MDIDLDCVIRRAKQCSSASQFQRNNYALYKWAKNNGHLAVIDAILPRVEPKERARRANAARRYTDNELITDAKNFKTRIEWHNAGLKERLAGNYSHYGAAIKRGKEFMCRCCGHMARSPQTLPVKYSLEELSASAAQFKHRSDWKSSRPEHYRAAWRRKLLDQCCNHMDLKANPYAGDYIIYVYEFTDRHVYIGLTFRTEQRHAQHAVRGPVAEHIKACTASTGFTLKIIQNNIPDPLSAAQAERAWIAKYKTEGWTLLNKSRGGGLGAVIAIKWTKESVLTEARKFSTKQEWIDKSQFTYRLAKREGWFAEASAHMPARILGIGKGKKFTTEHRRKLSEAKQGVTQSKDHCEARSKAVKSWWSLRKQPV